MATESKERNQTYLESLSQIPGVYKCRFEVIMQPGFSAPYGNYDLHEKCLEEFQVNAKNFNAMIHDKDSPKI